MRLLARPERAHEHESPHPRLAGGGEQVARAVDHDALELLLAALPDRDEVDDRVHALHGAAEALRVGHVAFGALRSGDRAFAHECAHVVPGVLDRANHVRADEPGAAGDEDLHDSTRWKFFQYFDGVGPRWPWYFDPSLSAPYGVSAGSVSSTNESCPIGIP